MLHLDFETTTGDSVFFDPKMFVVSYCQIYSFHPSLELDKIVFFEVLNRQEIYETSHFKQERVTFFNKTTFYQMKDAGSAVLAYVVAYKLKFTVDTLNDWFSNVIKPKFFELDDIKKQVFLKENPIVNSKTVCSLFGFLLDAEDGWFDFEVKCE